MHKMCGQMQCEAEGDERSQQRDPRRQLAAVWQQRDENSAGERGEKDQGKD